MSNGARLLSFLKAKIGQAWAWLQPWYQRFSTAVRAPQYDWVWETGALVGLLPLSYYMLRLWYHGWGYDPDFLNFTAGVATLVALVSLLGIQSKWGEELATRVNQVVNLSRLWQNSRRVCLSIWVGWVVAAILFHLGYPLAATYYYNPRGADALGQGRYSEARQYFRQAISLSPRNAQAHYNLANTYEVLYQSSQAIASYQKALELDDSLWPAYNNLGRLYLSQNEPDAALTTLLAGYKLTNTRRDSSGQLKEEVRLGQAVLQKNIGWAYLKKELHEAALEELQAAIKELKALDQTSNVSIYLAESYRLTALLYGELGQLQEAEQAWSDTKGRAGAVRDSCKKVLRGPAAVGCLNAEIWTAEAKKQLKLFQGDE